MAGLPITLDALQNWEIGRRSPAPLAAIALGEFLNRNPKIQALNHSKKEIQMRSAMNL
jgi:DNA-binding transcriptional regulator YiaG